MIGVADADHRMISYTYDVGGRLAERHDPGGAVTAYHYDSAGHLSELRDGSNTLLVRYSYDAAGQLSRVENGNGSSTTYAYSATGQIAQIIDFDDGGNAVGRLAYAYDAGSRVVTASTLDGDWTYGYDAAGQLTHAVFELANIAIQDQDLTYVYDVAGNRVQTIKDGVVTSYVTNDLNQYISVGGGTYAYDIDGNLISRTHDGEHWNYGYDEEGQLITVTGPDGTWSYEYDAFGNRIASTHNGIREEFVNDPLVNSVLQEYDGTGNLLATNLYGNGLAGRASSTHGTYYFSSDIGGNVTALTGSDGEIVASYTYSPFGEILLQSGTPEGHFQFSGKYGVVTDETGLDFMRARYYEPTLGRFISRDPSGLDGGVNLYSYVENSPTNLNDPVGLWAVYDDLLVMGVGGAAGIASQLVEDALGGKLSGFNAYASKFVGGAVAAETAYYLIPLTGHLGAAAGAGATGAAAQYITEQLLDGKPVDWGTAGGKSLEGAAFGSATFGIGTKLKLDGINAGRNSFEAIFKSVLTKLERGTISDISAKTLLKAIVSQLPGASIEGGLESFQELLGKIVEVVRPRDPNDLLGPQSFGPEHFVASGAIQPYTIRFENAEAATAPAQHIVITQLLDADLDCAHLPPRPGSSSTTSISISPGNQAFHGARIDLTATQGLLRRRLRQRRYRDRPRHLDLRHHRSGDRRGAARRTPSACCRSTTTRIAARASSPTPSGQRRAHTAAT